MGMWGSATGTVTIDNFNNSGIIQTSSSTKAVDFAKNSTVATFKNNGTIIGGNNAASVNIGTDGSGGATITTFENSGIIGNGSSKFGITVWGTGGSKSTITNFKNSGTISSNGGEAIYFSNALVDTFNNSGTIKTKYNYGVNVAGRTTIKIFTNSGTIKSTGTIPPSSSNYSVSAGLFVTGGIQTFINEGLISGIAAGIKLTQSKIDNFTNKGTIESTKNNDEKSGAVILATIYNSASTIDNFSNDGMIKSNSNGILAEAGNTINTLINKGTIDANLNGISFYDTGGTSGGTMKLGKIILENGSIIQAGNNGINIDHGTNKDIEADGIDVKSGARISGGNAGIYIAGGKKINAKITISGSVTGGIAGIVNEGIIGESTSDGSKGGIIISGGSVSSSSGGSGIVNQGNGSISGEIKVESGGSVEGGITNTGNGSISGSITVENGGKLDSITNTSTSDTGISGSITNNSDNNLEISNGEGATIGGGITNNGNADLIISNEGKVGKDEHGNTVTNNGNGSVGIKDWVVSSDENGKLDTIVVGGDGANNVKVDNITIDQGNLDLDELGDINNIISGVNQGNIGNIGTNGGGEISLNYDPISGKLTTDFNLNASISGATFRSLISTTSRKSTFIDNVMGNSMQSFYLGSSSRAQRMAMSEKGNLYADASDYIKSDLNNGTYGYNKEHSLFILPYTSSQNVELSLNEESKGHTKGTIIGYSTLKDSGIYGVYAGYEDTKMSSTYFDVNNRTYYAGLKYFNTLFTTSKGQEVYIKAQGKVALIKNDLTKKIGSNEAKAEPNSYAYGINTGLGMNFISDKDIFSPEIGLAYEGGYTEAFSMKNTIGSATVNGGERTYANYLNLFSTKTSFTWFRDWLPNLKTSVELGAKFNINPNVKAEARFGNIKVNDEFYLPRVQKFMTTSLIIPVNEAFYFSLNYNGMFDKDGNTHTGFAQFNYVW